MAHLQAQLETVDWYILDDLSTFDLDLDHLISESTAKELTKLELNHYSFHRKFDGKLDTIDLGLKDRDKNEKKMAKVFDILGYGLIEDFIDHEDIDEEDLTSSTPSPSSSSSSESEESDSEDTRAMHKGKDKPVPKKGIPQALLNSNLPRFAKAKRTLHKK